ncbi:hypothetical protein [Luteimicrobium sp. DT211]|uniref:hypothetical protein n=1 Tax=Luteimicrobium sp. DT211 TaxID=3393412 RepID=UPI003CEA6130
MRSRRLTALALAAALLGPAAAVGAAAAPATAATTVRSHCTVTMSTTRPKQYSSTTARISHVGSRAKVVVKAKYKTTTNTKSTTATTAGKASVTYRISRATVGRRVPVTVTAKKGSHVWTCSTSFVPRHR